MRRRVAHRGRDDQRDHCVLPVREGQALPAQAEGPTAAEMAAKAHGRCSVESADWGRPVGSDDDGPDMARSRS
jgi:hypothetical protein